MSLGMMLYKPPRHLTRKSRRHATADKATEQTRPTRVSSKTKTGAQSSYIDNDFFASGAGQSANRADNNYVICETRSIALPLVFALAIIGLVLSFVHPSLARASDDISNANKVILAFCQGSGISIQSPDGDSATPAAVRVTNDSSEMQQVNCPIDMLPLAKISHAELSLVQPNRMDNDQARTRSRCALMSRNAMGGQARGIAVTAGDARENTLALPALKAAMDEFRYIECKLAPGASITAVSVVGGQQEVKAASRAEARSDWTLLSSKADERLLKLPRQ